MNVVTLPVRYKSQTQWPVVKQKEVVSSQYSVVSRFPPPTQSSVLSPQHSVLVGRDNELTHLHSLLEKAMSGERQIVFVSGEAGIGKTTLIDAFVAHLRERVDLRISAGQCVEQYGPGEAYMPLLEAIVRLCQGPSRERRIADLKRYAPSLLVQLPGLLDAAEHARLQERVHGTSRERMLREMAQAAELFTARRGLVLVLEDLHWSDVSTLEWLSYIARRREPAKLLILGTYRPTDILASGHPLRGIVQELQSRRQCEELRVTSLSENAIAEYLYSRFGEMTLPGATATTLARRTGGNPLFVVNTVDYFVQHGTVTQEAGQWTLQLDKLKAVGEGIPDTLRQLIERQVERLSEVEQRLLEVASITGVEFTSMDVAAGLSTSVDEVEASCEQLARAGQWLRSVGITELPDGTVSGRYSFLHAMYHEAIYARIAEIRRIQLHRRIATHKEAAYGERTGEIATELAMHCERGQDYRKAVQYLQQAGENAVRRSAHQEAIAHLTKGLELLTSFPEIPERAQQEFQLRLTLGTSLMVIKGYAAPELEGIYARARELNQQMPETLQILAVLGGLWTFYTTRAQLQTALELAEQGLTVAEKRQRPTASLWAHCFMGQTLYGLGRLQESRTHFEQSLHFYDSRKHNPRVATSPQDAGETSLAYLARVLWLLGYPQQAVEKSEAACTLAQHLGHPYSLAHALSLSASLHQLRGEAPAAHKQAEVAIALLTESGSPYRLAQGTILRGWALAEQGEQQEGIAQMLHGLTAWQASGAELWRPYYLSLLAEAHLKANQLDEGQRVIAEALQLVETGEEHVFDAEIYRLYGELLLTQEIKRQKVKDKRQKSENPDPRSQILEPQPEAEAYFQKAIAIAQGQRAKSLELRAVTSLAHLWQSQGKKDDARELLQEVHDWFTEGFDTADVQAAEALLVALGGRVKTEEEKQKSKACPEPSRRGKKQKAKIGSEEWEDERTTQRENGRQEEDKQIAPSPERPVAPSSAQPPTPNTFRPEGDYWTVSYHDTTCRLKETRGFHFIAQLLQHPQHETHVLTLVTLSDDVNSETAEVHSFHDSNFSNDHRKGLSDAGEMLDPQARAAYKQRLSELREELDEAQRFHDLGRSEQLAAEIDFLTHELTSAVGLGGRTRRMGSPAERARVNVTRAIKIAVRRISQHHPALGRHLATTIRTGAYCSYRPDVYMRVTWQG